MQAPIKLNNRTARWLWLESQGLGQAPTGPLDTIGLIQKLGFVQLDTIQVVSRAHHHILWSRNQNYREDMLNPLLAKDRAIFEHFTHDASVIPMTFLPAWQRQFRRMRTTAKRWHGDLARDPLLDHIKARIHDEGALSTHAFDTKQPGPKAMWSRPPHKRALDYMWMTGSLATCFRKGFIKYYNLPERVFPAPLRQRQLSETAELDLLLRAAIERIAIGTPAEIQKFWDTSSARETQSWISSADLIPVEVENHDGSRTKALGAPDLEQRLANLNAPTSRLRILNPFDPTTRDRTRLKRLFGYDYRIEMFVPAAKRIWGYYVYPLLEGDRFIGRIEVKADRAQKQLIVQNLWIEDRVKWPATRQQKLEAELHRLARFVDCRTITWQVTPPFSLA